MATDRDFQYDLRPSLQPLLLPVCALAAGIATGAAARIPLAHALAACTALAAVSIAARRAGSVRIAFAALLAAVAMLGAAREAAERRWLDERPVRQLVDSGRIRPGDALELAGIVEDVPDRPPSGARLKLRVKRLRPAGGDWIDSDGRAVVSVRLPAPGDGAVFDALGLERGTPVLAAVEASDDLAFRNPGVETLRSATRRRGRDLAVRAIGPGAFTVESVSRGCPLLRRLSAFRVWGLSEIDAAFPPRSAGVLRALLLGDESHLDEATAENYRRSGAYHVLVISGAHVALLAAVCVAVARMLSRSRVLLLAAGAGPAWLYVLVLGAPAPVVRAALAVTVVFLAPLAGRRAPPPNTVALAALVVLMADPSAIRDPGFQLTFAAVAAIVCVAAPTAEKLADIGRWRPHRASPYPPVCPDAVRVLAELLFWDERKFRDGQRLSPVRLGAAKHRAAVWASRLRLQGTIRRLVIGLWIAVAVQLALAPLSVTSFGRLTLAGTAAALAVEVLLGSALVAGLGFLLVRAAAPAMSEPVAWIANILVELSNEAAARAPDCWPAATPSGWSVALLWASPIAVVAIASILSRWRPVPDCRSALAKKSSPGPLRKLAALAMAAIAASAGIPSPNSGPDGLLHAVFFDVGQGDAALVRFPDGTTMLIDTGGRPRFDEPLGFDDGEPLRAERFDVGDRVVSESLLAQGISSVDYVVATHGDVDHVGGFRAVLDRLSVGQVVVGAGADDAEREFARLAWSRGIPVVTLGCGDALAIGGASLEALWPPPAAPAGNDGSLVFRVVYGERSLLFTGDIESSGEEALLRLAVANGWDLGSDVLKVAHHGSRGASSEAFLIAVHPRWAVISAPRLSPYGHPHAEAVARLRTAGAVVLQTGADGAVGFTTDGRSIALRRIGEPGTQLLPADFDHGARLDRTTSPGGLK